MLLIRFIWLVPACFFLLQMNVVMAQSSAAYQYTMHLQEEVEADYKNLLDTSSTRNYKMTARDYRFRVKIQRVDESLSYFNVVVDSMFESDLPKNDMQNISFFFDRDSENLSEAILCFDVAPTSNWVYFLKNLLSYIPYHMPDSSMFKWHDEPCMDGVYQAKFDLSNSTLKNEQQVTKSKQVEYSPGTSTIFNAIDSFSFYAGYHSEKAYLSRFTMFEKKHQRIGNRVLAWINTRISLVSDPTELPALELPKLNSYSIRLPIFQELSHSQRMERISKLVSPAIESAQVLPLLMKADDNSSNHVVRLIRTGLVLHTLDIGRIRFLLDSLDKKSLPFKILEDALVEAGNPISQDVLADLLKVKDQPDFFYKRILVKVGVTAPIESEKLLQQILAIRKSHSDKSVSRVAGLTLSNNVQLLKKDKKSQISDAIDSALEAIFIQSERKREDTIQWLQEAGNSGNIAILPIVNYCLALKESDPDLYKEAIYSLRFVAGANVENILVNEFNIAAVVHRSLLLDILRLRFPSREIRGMLYHYLVNADEIEIQDCGKAIRYLASWRNEIKTLNLEISQLVIPNDNVKQLLQPLLQTK